MVLLEAVVYLLYILLYELDGSIQPEILQMAWIQ